MPSATTRPDSIKLLVDGVELVVEIQQEMVCIGQSAKILIRQHDHILTLVEIEATVEPQMGADGGIYPAVKLERKDLPSP